MSLSKEEKTQKKVEKKIARANKKLSKKQDAYEEALASNDPKKIAKAEKKLAKAEKKYEERIEKIEEKYDVSLRPQETQQLASADNITADINERSQAAAPAPGTTDVYGNPIQTEPQDSQQNDEQYNEEQANQQPQQQQSSGDPFVDLLLTMFTMAMEMQRQRFEAEMAFKERAFALITGKEYPPLYNENEQAIYNTPINAPVSQTETQETVVPTTGVTQNQPIQTTGELHINSDGTTKYTSNNLSAAQIAAMLNKTR